MAPNRGNTFGRVRHSLPALLLFSATLLGSLALLPAVSGGATTGSDVVVVTRILVASSDGSYLVEQQTTRVVEEFKVNPNVWPKEAMPVVVRFNLEGAPTELNPQQIIKDALATWNAAPSSFAFSWGGTSTSGTEACLPDDQFVPDGVNTIRFLELSSSTLGRTCSIFEGGKLREFDMELDTGGFWSTQLPVPEFSYDLPTTILHELGHGAGLGHSCAEGGPTCTSTLRKSVMYRSIDAGEARRVLTADDIAGLQAAYPPAAPTPTPTPPLEFQILAPLLSRD